MSQDDSGIIFTTIPDPVPTSTPPTSSLTPLGSASSQTATQSSMGGSLSYNTILITNAAGVGASLCVIVAYYLLRRKHARLMKRTTLKLSLAMAMTDLVFHIANLAGYGDLPDGFGCAFIGGWLFAAPTILSLFYACAIALNTQLVFVHHRIPGDAEQKWFLGVPPVVTLLITIPTLAAGVYGFDPLLEYCWYVAEGVSRSLLLLRMIFTFNLWCFLALAYLVLASVLIIRAMFRSKSRMAQLSTTPRVVVLAPSTDIQYPFEVSNHNASLGRTLERRDAARKALSLRLFGYILVPVICVLPGVILDFIAKSGTENVIDIDDTIETIGDVLAGLMGSFNAILFGLDPSVLAVLYAIRVDGEEERKRVAEGRNNWDSEKGLVIRVDVQKVDDRDRDLDNVSVKEIADYYHGL